MKDNSSHSGLAHSIPQSVRTLFIFLSFVAMAVGAALVAQLAGTGTKSTLGTPNSLAQAKSCPAPGVDQSGSRVLKVYCGGFLE